MTNTGYDMSFKNGVWGSMEWILSLHPQVGPRDGAQVSRFVQQMCSPAEPPRRSVCCLSFHSVHLILWGVCGVALKYSLIL